MKNKVSIYDIAKYVGVSPASVSYVINGVNKVSEETKQKVLNAIKELGYVANYTAKALSTGKSFLIGILLPLNDASIAFLQNPFYSEFMGGVELGLAGFKYDIVIGNIKDQEYLEEWIKRRNLDGVILIGTHEKFVYQILKDINIPTVLVDDDGVDSADFNNVKSNDLNGMYLATKHLIELGHKNIGFVGNASLYLVDKKRYDGYKKAMDEVGYKIEKGFIYEADATFDDGLKIALDIIKRNNVTAVVCSADILGIAIMKKYKELGYDIPSNLSIVGFDDIQSANFIYPGLTTVHQEIGEKGVRASKILIDILENKIEDKVLETLEPYLVKRNSVRKIS